MTIPARQNHYSNLQRLIYSLAKSRHSIKRQRCIRCLSTLLLLVFTSVNGLQAAPKEVSFYEDHYPRGSSKTYPDGQTADANRRAAWEMSMAGTYQTTGETAKRGTGIWPDTGGGWINGRGDESMVMLVGYDHMADFFTSFDWWKTDPHDELVNKGSFCLADPGKLYVIYMAMGSTVTVKLEPGRYEGTWFNPRNGRRLAASVADGPLWITPMPPDSGDWALLLKRIE
jgi:hypothetical protein